jgi:prevent-host-death family protein
MTKTLPISEARAQLRDLTEEASRTMGRIIITRNGKPEAVLMGYDEYESWVETLETLADPEEMKAIRQSEEDIRAGRVRSFEEVFGEPLGAARREPVVRLPLTEQELRVMRLLACGERPKEISRALHISMKAVEGALESVKASTDGSMALMKSLAAHKMKAHAKAEKRRVIKSGR